MSDKPPHEALRELLAAMDGVAITVGGGGRTLREFTEAHVAARASLENEPGSHAWACLHCWTMGTAGEECAKTDACHMHPLHWSSRASLEDEPGLPPSVVKVLFEIMWGSWDGGDVQDYLHDHGILTVEKYDPEKHGESDCEPGDDWYTFAPSSSPAPDPEPYGWILECLFPDSDDEWCPFADGYEQSLESAKESLAELGEIHGAENCRITVLHKGEQDG